MRPSIQKISTVLLFLLMAPLVVPQVEIEGGVQLVGTSLFPSAIITTHEGKTYYFDEALFEQFAPYQNQTIKIRARIKEVELELADKSKKFTRLVIFEAAVL